MAKYKIKVIQVLLKNNKTAGFGEIVDEANFSTPVSELMKGNYIAVATQADFKKIKEVESQKQKEAEEKKLKDEADEAQRLKDEEAANALLNKK